MSDPALTRPGEENTCSAGLGWLATCREGWEFLQQEGWEDGGMGVEEEKESVSMCLLCPDINFGEDVGILSFCQAWLASC